LQNLVCWQAWYPPSVLSQLHIKNKVSNALRCSLQLHEMRCS